VQPFFRSTDATVAGVHVIVWIERRRSAWRRPAFWAGMSGAAALVLLGAALRIVPPAQELAAEPTRPHAAPTDPLLPHALRDDAHPVLQATDLLAGFDDLHRAFDRLSAQGDVAAQAAAARAWQACVPAFLPGDGARASLDARLALLPADPLRGKREAALRALWSRCQGFFTSPRDRLLAQAATLRAQRRFVGEREMQLLAAGEPDAALASADELLASGDVRALAALSGFARRWLDARHVASSPVARHAADATDAALALLDCDLGADCGERSLGALQLCAAEALCEGSELERRLARPGPSVDRASVDRERRRLAATLRDGPRSVADWLQLR
jgi:hypothetical protein